MLCGAEPFVCPQGMSCGVDRFCHRPESTRLCTDSADGATDRGVDDFPMSSPVDLSDREAGSQDLPCSSGIVCGGNCCAAGQACYNGACCTRFTHCSQAASGGACEGPVSDNCGGWLTCSCPMGTTCVTNRCGVGMYDYAETHCGLTCCIGSNCCPPGTSGHSGYFDNTRWYCYYDSIP